MFATALPPQLRARACQLAGVSAVLLAGCAQLPPPGAPIARLPADANMQAPALSDAEKARLSALDKQIYDEQERTIERNRQIAAYNDAVRTYWNNTYVYGGYGYGAYGWGGPGWYGPGWYGPGWYGPGWYGPRSGVSIGVGF